MEQSEIEAREDVLVFTSDPLDSDMEVTGLVEAEILVRSSAPTADWTARLCEVREDTSSYGLVDGIFRWTKPAGSDGPNRVAIRLGHIGHLFRAGTHLRLQVASSNFPRFDRNPQSSTSTTLATIEDFSPATQVICGGPDATGMLKLPILRNSYPQWLSVNSETG